MMTTGTAEPAKIGLGDLYKQFCVHRHVCYRCAVIAGTYIHTYIHTLV